MNYGKWALVLAAGLVIFGRAPQLFLTPRLWAEEVTVYLTRGLTLPWYEALWLPDSGYVNLLANVAGILAGRAVPLEAAPVISLVISFVIMLLPVVLVLTSEEGWKNIWGQVVAVAIILLAVPNQEVWLNSITSQFHLSLGAGIILALPLPRSERVKWLHRAVMLLAALGGAASVLLAPLFLFKAWQERSRERVFQGAILSGAIVIQLFVAAQYGFGHHVVKFAPGTWWLVTIVKSILLPFLGSEGVRTMLPLSWPMYLGATMAAVVMGVWLWLTGTSHVRWLLAAALALIFFSLVLSLDAPQRLVSELTGNRYFFAPNALLGLALVGRIFRARSMKNWMWAVGGVVLVWLAVVGVREYLNPDPLFFEGPSWRAEIRAWQEDPAHVVRVWPRPWMWEVPH